MTGVINASAGAVRRRGGRRLSPTAFSAAGPVSGRAASGRYGTCVAGSEATSTTAAGLFVEILGPLSVTMDGQPIGLTGPSRCGLFARLVLAHGEAVGFDTLMDDLWPGRAPDSAKRNLQTQVHNLRALPGLDRIETIGGRAYRLVLAPTELDAVLVDDAFHAARSLAAVDPGAALTRTRDALARFRGPPLSEFASQDWARGEAVRLDQLRKDVRALEIELRLETGDDATLISELRVLSEAHPENERYWEALMTALYRAGHQKDALAAYQSARRRLGTQFGLEPGPALKALEHQILRHDPGLIRGTAIAPTSPLEGCSCWVDDGATPPVGRTVELARLGAAVEARARLIVLSGETGSGKTKLVTELVRGLRAAPRHRTVLFGSCDDSLSRPFPALADIAEHAEIHNPGLLTGLESSASMETLRRLIEPEDDAAAPPATGRNALVSALSALVARAGSSPDGDGTPPLLIIDQVHDVDTDTLDVIGRLLAPMAATPVTVLLISQPSGLIPTANLADWLGTLPHQVEVVEIDLLPLDEIAVGELAEALGRPDVDRAELLSGSGGNPMFIAHLLADRDGAPITTPLARLARRRIARCSPEAVTMLQAAAITGARPRGWLTAALSGLDADAAASALGELLDDGLLIRLAKSQRMDDRSDPAAVSDRYWFVHGLIRRVMLEEVGPAKRQAMHRRAAELLADRRAGGDVVGAGDIARHYLAAAPLVGRAPAIDWLRTSADSAVRNSAYERADAELAAALALVSDDADDDVLAAELLIERGRVWSTFVHEGDGRALLYSAITRARRAGRLDLAALAALHVGGVLPMGDASDPSIPALVTDALDWLVDDEPFLRAELTARLAELGYWDLSESARRALCDQAERFCDAAPPEVRARVGINRFWACELDAGPIAAWRLIERLDDLVAQAGDQMLALQVIKCRLHATLTSGDLEAADDIAARFGASANEVGGADLARLDRLYHAMRAGSQGDFDRAEALADESKRLLVSTGRELHAEVVDHLVRLPWQIFRGNHEEARQFVVAISGFTTRADMWTFLDAWLLAISGDVDGADRLIDGFDLASFLEGDARYNGSVIAAAAAMVAHATGRADWAALLVDWFADHADAGIILGQTVFMGFGWHYLGMAEATLGGADHNEAAVDALRHASRRSARVGAEPWKLLADIELARLGAGTDDDRRAEAPEALAARADLLGLNWLAGQARALSPTVVS